MKKRKFPSNQYEFERELQRDFERELAYQFGKAIDRYIQEHAISGNRFIKPSKFRFTNSSFSNN